MPFLLILSDVQLLMGILGSEDVPLFRAAFVYTSMSVWSLCVYVFFLFVFFFFVNYDDSGWLRLCPTCEMQVQSLII